MRRRTKGEEYYECEVTIDAERYQEAVHRAAVASNQEKYKISSRGWNQAGGEGGLYVRMARPRMRAKHGAEAERS